MHLPPICIVVGLIIILWLEYSYRLWQLMHVKNKTNSYLNLHLLKPFYFKIRKCKMLFPLRAKISNWNDSNCSVPRRHGQRPELVRLVVPSPITFQSNYQT